MVNLLLQSGTNGTFNKPVGLKTLRLSVQACRVDFSPARSK